MLSDYNKSTLQNIRVKKRFIIIITISIQLFHIQVYVLAEGCKRGTCSNLPWEV